MAFARCPVDGALLQPFEADPLLGARFADRYVIESFIGEGAMGRVYRARHTRVSRDFAVKVLFGDHAADQRMQERFAREAEAASRLQHPNVVPVLDFGETEGGALYLVMDYVDGPSLSEVIAREGPLYPPRVHHLLRQLCSGLAHAHSRNLIHRDFKTDNVLVTGTGDEELARIADFGIAVLLEPSDAPTSRLTSEGMVLGTPAYMAPEQATQQPIDHRTDLFSLGVAVYEMLAGMLPFDGSPLEVARQNLNDDPPPVAQRSPLAPGDRELEAIARKLMEKDPADRFQSAREVLEALMPRAPQSGRLSAERARASRGAARARGNGGADTVPSPAAERAGHDLNEQVATDRVARRGEGGARSRRRLAGMAGIGAVALIASAMLVAVLAQPSREVAEGKGDKQERALENNVESSLPAPALDDTSAAPADAGSGLGAGEARVAEVEEDVEEDVDAGARNTPQRAAARRPPPPEERARPSGEDRRRRQKSAQQGAEERDRETQADEGVTREALTYRYRAVGAALQGVGDGPEAEALREAYLALPYASALGDPARRVEVHRQLRRLEARIRRLGGEPDE